MTEVIRVQNEALAEACATTPERFVAFASVALQFPDLAAQQLEDGVKKYGLKGAAVGGSVADQELAEFYGSLFESEARHHTTYVRLAKYFGSDDVVKQRLQELSALEAEIIAAGDELPRMHS